MRLSVLMSVVRMRRCLVVPWRVGRPEAWCHGLPGAHVQQRRHLDARMAGCFHAGVGVASANGFYRGCQPSIMALIAVVHNNVVSIAKLRGGLGLLLELLHNVWRIDQGNDPVDAA